MQGQSAHGWTAGALWPRLAIAAALLFIAALTLLPAGGHPEPVTTCIICGLRGAADAFLNVLLFMPLGAALAWAGLGTARAVPLGAALSIAIEVAQLWIPGRESSIGDVITNTTGTAAGVLLFQLLPPLLVWARRHARALELALPLATLALLACGSVLLRPAFSLGTYYPVWHPGPEHPYVLSGPVTLARLGDLPLRRRYIEEGALLSSLWLEGAPLRLEIQAAGDTMTEASVFALYDADGHELLHLGVDGADVVLRYRTAAAMLRLDQPDMRLAAAAPQLRRKLAVSLTPSDVAAARLDASQPVAPAPRRRPGGWARLVAGVAAPFNVPRSWSPDSAPVPERGRAPTAELGGRADPPGSASAPTLVR
ncbi:MAG TPA: VanZ family protein, partial [Longimicrobiales bacterium]